MPALRCFTYMSTAFVNSNQPKGSVIREELYPLAGEGNDGQEEVDTVAIAEQLLALPEQCANKKV